MSVFPCKGTGAWGLREQKSFLSATCTPIHHCVGGQPAWPFRGSISQLIPARCSRCRSEARPETASESRCSLSHILSSLLLQWITRRSASHFLLPQWKEDAYSETDAVFTWNFAMSINHSLGVLFMTFYDVILTKLNSVYLQRMGTAAANLSVAESLFKNIFCGKTYSPKQRALNTVTV